MNKISTVINSHHIRLDDHINFDHIEIDIRDTFFEQMSINDTYTLEERKDLADMLQIRTAATKQGTLNQHSCDLERYNYWLSPGTLTKDEFAMLFEPLKNMPLYINDNHIDKQVVAAWRLKWAK
jgi:hypothetical protein